VSTPGPRLHDAIERIQAFTAGRQPIGARHDEADDSVGTIGTDDAIGFDPISLLSAFDRHGAEVVAIGQVAGILHGSSELTGDLDLLWSGSESDAPRIAAALADAEALLFDHDMVPITSTPDGLTLAKVMFETATASGDLCTPRLPWGALDVGAFMSRAEQCVTDGVTIRYITKHDLIAMRRAVGRPKDIRRADELEQL